MGFGVTEIEVKSQFCDGQAVWPVWLKQVT